MGTLDNTHVVLNHDGQLYLASYKDEDIEVINDNPITEEILESVIQYLRIRCIENNITTLRLEHRDGDILLFHMLPQDEILQ